MTLLVACFAPELGATETADSADSTDSADSADSAERHYPEITAFILSWYEYPRIGWIAMGEFTVVDEPDDVVGGRLDLELTQAGTTDAYSLEMVEIGDDGAGAAYYDPDVGVWVFGIADLDTALAVEMSITVTDTAGNTSDAAVATVAAL